MYHQLLSQNCLKTTHLLWSSLYFCVSFLSLKLCSVKSACYSSMPQIHKLDTNTLILQKFKKSLIKDRGVAHTSHFHLSGSNMSSASLYHHLLICRTFKKTPNTPDMQHKPEHKNAEDFVRTGPQSPDSHPISQHKQREIITLKNIKSLQGN